MKMRNEPGYNTSPFFNYLWIYRLNHAHWPPRKIAVEGAIRWCALGKRDQQKYYSGPYKDQSKHYGVKFQKMCDRVTKRYRRTTRSKPRKKEIPYGIYKRYVGKGLEFLRGLF